METGEFDNLRGAGKPLEIDFSQDWMQSKLRKMGFLPREVELRKRLAMMEKTSDNYKVRETLTIEIDILTQARLIP